MNVISKEECLQSLMSMENSKNSIKARPLTTDAMLLLSNYFRCDYINYFEAIILPNGTIMHAIPSHTECVVKLGCTIDNITRSDMAESIPSSANVLGYLLDKYNMVAVWYRIIISPETITPNQTETISFLQKTD